MASLRETSSAASGVASRGPSWPNWSGRRRPPPQPRWRLSRRRTAETPAPPRRAAARRPAGAVDVPSLRRPDEEHV